MVESLLPVLSPIAAELTLMVLTLGLLMYGVFDLQKHSLPVYKLAIAAIILSVLVGYHYFNGVKTAMGGLYISDGFSIVMKAFVGLAAVFSLQYANSYYKALHKGPFEYSILVCLSVLGMFAMISANNFMTLYLALELQSLPLYLLASIRKDESRSAEAGLKYFSLGAVSSGLLLYGISLIYGFTGSVDFSTVSAAIAVSGSSMGIIVGIVLVLSGLAFKISAVPFHMWTPDVYEGAPTPVTGFFAVAPKVATMCLIIRVLYGAFGFTPQTWIQIIVLMSVASMAWGAIAAITQHNIKRLLAYSSIGHMGYAMVALVAVPSIAIEAVVTYLLIYGITAIGVFAILLSLRNKDVWYEEIRDLSGLAQSQPFLAFCMGVLMFSMAGIPPTAGFLAKFYVFKAAVTAGYVAFAVFGVVMSVIGAYYYLRVVKVMYMDDPVVSFSDQDLDRGLKIAIGLSTIVSGLLIIQPNWLLELSDYAAKTFYSGL